MKSKLVFAVSLMALTSLAFANEFTIKVEPKKYAYSIEKNTHTSPSISTDLVKLRFKVIPESKSQTFWSLSCSYYENWKTDNPKVVIPEWSCDKNIPRKFDEGKAFTGELSVALTELRLGDKVKFHLLFSPYRDQNMKEKSPPSESNEIIISIVE